MFNDTLMEEFSSRDTPFYHYDLTLLRKTIDEVKLFANQFDFDIHYAVKANSNRTILQEIEQAGFGADCVSGNEVKLAADVGFQPDSILFAGVGKTDKEIKTALSLNIKAFNCESAQEIEVINQLAEELGKTAEIS